MEQVASKIYYCILTGEVILVTTEMQGCVTKTTKEKDMTIYPQLKDKNIDIDFVELEYGTFASTFNNAKSYKVNLKTKKLEIEYYTVEEIQQREEAEIKEQDLNSRVSDISTYLSNSDEATISNIENSILEIVQNKILNGGM